MNEYEISIPDGENTVQLSPMPYIKSNKCCCTKQFLIWFLICFLIINGIILMIYTGLMYLLVKIIINNIENNI